MHTPDSKEYNGADRAVVFIHGFMGSPDQFVGLAQAVYENGCSYITVLLPGHGAGMDEFVKFGAPDWERHVQSELDKIKRDYKNIILIGHSMGGLLALNASLVKENSISGVVLLGTPLRINLFNLKSLLMRLRLMRFSRDNEIKSAYMSSASVTGAKVFYYPLVIRPVINLYKLIKKTKRRLPEVFVPVCMFHSKTDETTSYKSAALLHEGLCNTQKTAVSLSRSWHAFYYDDERRIIKDNIIEFISQF